jgi:hypothetical protein
LKEINKKGPKNLLVLIALAITLGVVLKPMFVEQFGLARNDMDKIAAATRDQQSNIIVEFEAVVLRTLPDDIGNVTHQNFLTKLENGHTLLIAHNLDLAARVPVSAMDKIRIRGEYDWSYRGGLIHWTHHDPNGQREGGWIKLDGQTYR